MKSFTPALIAPGFSDQFGRAMQARTHVPEAVTKDLLARRQRRWRPPLL
jgi:hypothetical protein